MREGFFGCLWWPDWSESGARKWGRERAARQRERPFIIIILENNDDLPQVPSRNWSSAIKAWNLALIFRLRGERRSERLSLARPVPLIDRSHGSCDPCNLMQPLFPASHSHSLIFHCLFYSSGEGHRLLVRLLGTIGDMQMHRCEMQVRTGWYGDMET